MANISTFLDASRKYVINHKVVSALALATVLGGGYWVYAKSTSTTGQVRYVLSTVQTRTIISAISGSGQVSPSDQVDIKPKASGTITRVLVANGQNVADGQAIAYIDSTDAQKTVRDAQINVQSAKLSLQKLQQPADTLTLTQAQNAAQNARTDLSKSYSNSFNDINSAMLDLPAIMAGLQDIVIGTKASRGSQWNIDYYRDATIGSDNRASTYRDSAFNSYVAAKNAYDAAVSDFTAVTPSSAPATIEKMTNESYAVTQDVVTALNNSNSFIQYYEDQLKNRSQTPSPVADTALTDLASYVSKMNSHLSTLLSDTNSIASGKQNVTETQQSLDKTKAGADAIDVQSSQLSVTQRENALKDAQDALADYVIRAPFAGAIANLSIHPGDEAGSGTSVATLITTHEIADLSLNEVDAAKVRAGQKVTLTFDAIDGLSLTGQVVDVNPLGTVSQGVVSYDVKIAFDAQDPRVKAGMTVNASIQTGIAQNVLAIPSSAVKTQSGSSYALVFDSPPAQATSTASASQGILSTIPPRQQPVTTGISDNSFTEITSGLTDGQTIVSRTISGTAQTTSLASAPSLFGGGGTRTGTAPRGGANAVIAR